MLQLVDIKKRYKRNDKAELLVLNGINLQIKLGEFLAIIGKSGCGKSTLLNIIGGLDHNYEGQVLVKGEHISKTLSRQPRPETNASVGFVFQQPRLLPWKTVEDNIKYVLKDSGISLAQWDEVIEENLAMVGIKEFGKAYPSQLSGGMCARAALARALSINADILLMDEPFSSLDEITARGLRQDVLTLWRKKRMTTIFVTHDISEAVFLAQRVVILTPRPARIFSEVRIMNLDEDGIEEKELLAKERLVTQELEQACGLTLAEGRTRVACFTSRGMD